MKWSHASLSTGFECSCPYFSYVNLFHLVLVSRYLTKCFGLAVITWHQIEALQNSFIILTRLCQGMTSNNVAGKKICNQVCRLHWASYAGAILGIPGMKPFWGIAFREASVTMSSWFFSSLGVADRYDQLDFCWRPECSRSSFRLSPRF